MSAAIPITRLDQTAAASVPLPVDLLCANSDAIPSSRVFFQAWIWLECTPNRLDISATVPSSRTAASATFALNAGLCFFRVFAMSHRRPAGHSKGRLSLATCPVFPVHLRSLENRCLQFGHLVLGQGGSGREALSGAMA